MRYFSERRYQEGVVPAQEAGVEQLDLTQERKVFATILMAELQFLQYLMQQGMDAVEAASKYTSLFSLDGETSKVEQDKKHLLAEYKKQISDISIPVTDPEWIRTVYTVVRTIHLQHRKSLRGKIQHVWDGVDGGVRIPCGVLEFEWLRANEASGSLYHLPPGAAYIELHLPLSAFAKEEVGFSELKESLRQLAFQVQDSFSTSRAVVGCSWLMSTKIAARLGFSLTHTFPNDGHSVDVNPFERLEYWSQIVDRTGAAKTEQIKHLYEHRRLMLPLACGKIETAELLRRYGTQQSHLLPS